MANKQGKIVGRMVAYPEYVTNDTLYYPNESNYYSLYIKRLFVEKEFRNMGVGSVFIKVAAKDSYRRICDGKLHVIAQSLEYQNHPQQFYRKLGFDSQNKSHIKYSLCCSPRYH